MADQESEQQPAPVEEPAPKRPERRSRVRRAALYALALITAVVAALIVTLFSIDLGPYVKGEAERRGSDWLDRPMTIGSIRALLRRGPALTNAEIRVADLTIDTRARAASRGGHGLQLTTKEFALLEYLARRQGQVATRSDIAEHVWDGTFDPGSNLIEVYIQRLRRKIDDGHAVKLIHTRRGAGYTLASGRIDDDDL